MEVTGTLGDNMNIRYGIYHKEHKAYFSGFDANDQPVWADENHAKPYAERLHAEAQAHCFAMNDQRVQRKPVQLGASQ